MLKLEDLKPETGTFKLDLLPGVEFKLRKFNLEDEIWLKKTYGEDLEVAFRDKQAVCAMAWHQLDQEDRKHFRKQVIKIINDEGDEMTVEKGGLALFSTMVVGQLEQIEITKALLQTLGISRKMLTEMEVEAQKKSAAQSPNNPPTGPS